MKYTYIILALLIKITCAGMGICAPQRDAYVLTYFGGSDGQEALYMAYSYDALNWTAFNDNRPILKATVGNKSIRDPYVVRKADHSFVLMSTDSGPDNNTNYAIFWDSKDLITFTNERRIQLNSDNQHVWAPECVYDETNKNYIVYWSGNVIYANRTTDFINFTPAELMFDPGHVCIDADIASHNGINYLFYKDETGENTPKGTTGKALKVAKSTSFKFDKADIFTADYITDHLVEGPACIKDLEKDRWYLYYDYFFRGGVWGCSYTDDLSSGKWTKMDATQFSLPKGVRHGNAVKVTSEELAKMIEAYNGKATLARMPGKNAADPAITRIAFLGDSITEGVGVKERARDRYATVATRVLAGKHPGITEINLGQSGRALCQQETGYSESVLKQNPDAVVIQWGVNDQYWGYSVAEFAARYDALVAALRAARPRMPIVVTTLIADFRRPENQDAWIGEANIALQEIAARYRCHLADTHRAVGHQKALYDDLVHPNAAGAGMMAKTIVAALEAPPLSVEKSAVSFDQGTEVRFLQNVFLPKREGTEPQWVHVTEINPKGMNIESKVPVAIRTAPIYPAGSYRIVISDQSGAVVNTIASDVNWSRMNSFTFDPKDHSGPFRIEILPESPTNK